MNWRRLLPFPTAALLGLALLGTIAALVVLTARWQRQQQHQRLQQVAPALGALLGMHLRSDSELLDGFATVLESGRDVERLRPTIEGYLALQQHLLQLARVEADGRISLLFTAPGAVANAEPLAPRALDASQAGRSTAGFSQIFTCDPDNCIGLIRPADTRGAVLVLVYSLDRWVEHLSDYAGLVGVRLVVRGPSGEAVAGSSAASGLGPRVVVPLEPPGHGLQLEMSMPPPPRPGDLLGLGLLSMVLGVLLLGSLVALVLQLRETRSAASDAAARTTELRSVFSSLAEGVLVLGPDGSVQSSNAAAATILGLDGADLQGRRLPAWAGLVLHDDGRPYLPEDFPAQGSLCSGASRRDVVMGVRRPDGTLVWVSVNTQPLLRAGEPHAHGVVVSFSDISERRRAERELRRNRDLLQALLDHSPSVIAVRDLAGRYLLLNHAGERHLGLGRGEAAGRTLEECFEPGSAARIRQHDEQVVASRQPLLFDQQLVVNGVRRDYLTGVFPLLDDAGRAYAVGRVATDVTERRRAQAALEESQQRLAALLEQVGSANDMLASVVRCEARFIAGELPAAVFEELLAAAVRLTGSAFGFVAEVLEQADGTPFLTSLAITDTAWDEASRRLAAGEGGRLESRDLSTLFGAALRTGEIVVANDAGTAPQAAGHPPLQALVGIPLRHGPDLVGLVGLANRPGGYDADTVRSLEALLATAATLIEATRSARRRKEAERELQAALERALRTERELRLVEGAVEAAANAIVLTDRAGTILWVNQAFTTLTGYAAEEVVGGTTALLRSGAHDAAFYRTLWDTILRGEVWRGDVVNRRKDGSSYAEEMTITPLRSDTGELTHFVAVKQDVGWRRESEQRVRESEQRFRGLVQSVDAVVWEAEPEAGEADGFRFSFVSEQATRILGYPSGRWLGEPAFWTDHLHPEDREWAPGFCAAEAAAGRSYELEYRLRSADGRFVWVHDAVRVTADASGRAVRLSGVLVDVTRARELERALKTASEEWRATFDALDTALVVLDDSRHIERLNSVAMALLGAAWKDCLGREPWQVCPAEPWLTARTLVQGMASDAQLQVRDERGQVWDLHAQPVPASQERAGALILTLRDVTRLTELQESVRRSETWTAMGALVAGVAHEVRNPLFAMSANIDALAAVLAGRGEVEDLIRALRQERDRLSRLMEELLHYGRPAPPEMRLASLEPVLQAAFAHCAPLAGSRGVRLVRSGSTDGWRLRMNPDRLEEVFVNLLENACLHSPPGTDVRLEVESLEHPTGPRLLCRVRDAGPGFAADALPRLFEPFFTRRKGGTGLGLAIVQRFVLEHGGRVRAENDAAGGALMTVTLPLAHGHVER